MWLIGKIIVYMQTEDMRFFRFWSLAWARAVCVCILEKEMALTQMPQQMCDEKSEQES